MKTPSAKYAIQLKKMRPEKVIFLFCTTKKCYVKQHCTTFPQSPNCKKTPKAQSQLETHSHTSLWYHQCITEFTSHKQLSQTNFTPSKNCLTKIHILLIQNKKTSIIIFDTMSLIQTSRPIQKMWHNETAFSLIPALINRLKPAKLFASKLQGKYLKLTIILYHSKNSPTSTKIPVSNPSKQNNP